MNKSLLLLAAFACLSISAAADDNSEKLCCTSILAGRNATVDGSVITSHTCDGHYRSWISVEPASDPAAGTMRPILTGTMKTRFDGDTTGVRKVAEIPEMSHTYSYLNSGYPCLNEKCIGIGETTFGGPDQLCNPNSPMRIEELERLAMQRCSNARDAVLLMGRMAEKYGYGDAGECLTVADKREAWFFEIIGVGKNEKGAAWAAVRIPDDEIAVSANIPRIGYIDRNDSANCLCSDNLEKVALKHGLWDGKGRFSFWRAFHDDYGGGRNYSYREYYILSHLAPSLGLKYGMDELPLSVKPDAKVDVKKVFELLRSTYEGSDWDVSRNMVVKDKKGNLVRSPLATPWITNEMRDMLNAIKPGTAVSHRTPSVIWCAYSTVIQLRENYPEGMGGICWYSVDNPAQSPHIPFFSGNTGLPEAYAKCGQFEYYPDCALWQFRRANRLAAARWTANKEDCTKELLKLENETFRQLDSLQKNWSGAPEDLDAFTSSAYGRAARKWDEMEGKLWLGYWKGIL